MRFSAKVLNAEESFLNKWDSEVKMKIAEGGDILQFNLGQPDFACPDFVVKAIENVNRKSRNNFYNHTGGTERAREAVATAQNRMFGSDYGKKEAIITNGAKEAIFLSLAALVDQGEEVIVIAPHWPTYIEAVKFLGGKPVVVDAMQGFSLDIARIESAINEKTKAIIINNPNNPTGVIYGKDEMAEISRLAADKNLIIISDEVYSSTVFDGKKHISLAALPGMKDRTIVIDGFSKTLSMTGYRIGYALASEEIINSMIKIKSNVNGNTNSFFQMVIEEVIFSHYEEFMQFIDFALDKYSERREFVCAKLSEMGIDHLKPQGSFYVFPRIPESLGMDSEKFAQYLFDKAGIAVAPGIFFGKSFDDRFRISFGASVEDLEDGMRRLRKALDL